MKFLSVLFFYLNKKYLKLVYFSFVKYFLAIKKVNKNISLLFLNKNTRMLQSPFINI